MITVKAAPGVRVPMEHDPRRYITDTAPVAVTDSPYYRRRMKDGDLVCAEGKNLSKASSTQK